MDRKLLNELFSTGGDIHTIRREVSRDYEIAAFMRKSFDEDGPAFMFENIGGFPEWKVLGALYGTKERVLRMLGAKTQDQAVELFENAIKNPVSPKVVRHPPFNKNLYNSLFDVPICTYHEKDNGRYITGGVQVAWDEKYQVNVNGVFRMRVVDSSHLTLNANADRRLGRSLLRAHKKGESLDIAVPIGVDPVVMFASQAKVSETVDKYAVAGVLQGSPIEVSKCPDINAWVPTNSEVVIQCRSIPNATEEDVPFGDFTGTYSLHREVPLLAVVNILRRNNPIYQPIMTGFTPTEDHLIGWIPALSSYKRLIEMLGTEVVGIDIKSDFMSELHVAIKKRQFGDAMSTIMAVLATHVKFVYIHEEDIDVTSDKECSWSFLTRCQPEDGIHVFPTMVGGSLDPSGKYQRHTSKAGFDCTLPLDADRLKFEKIKVPHTEDIKW